MAWTVSLSSSRETYPPGNACQLTVPSEPALDEHFNDSAPRCRRHPQKMGQTVPMNSQHDLRGRHRTESIRTRPTAISLRTSHNCLPLSEQPTATVPPWSSFPPRRPTTPNRSPWNAFRAPQPNPCDYPESTSVDYSVD